VIFVRTLSGLAALCAAACSAPQVEPPDAGECRVTVWAKPQRAGVSLAVTGSWDDWGEARTLEDFGDGWRARSLDLPPGAYGYQIVEEGRGRLDEYNPLTTFRTSDDQEVSRLLVTDCGAPRIDVVSVQSLGRDGYEVQATVVPASSGARLDPSTVRASDDVGALEVVEVDEQTGEVVLRGRGRPRGKAHVTLDAADIEGVVAPSRIVAAWSDAVAPQWDDGIVYQIMIDRFRGDGGVALDPPPDPGARAGGTLDGIRAELEAGYFERLGVSALWLSPVYLNPLEARDGRFDGHLYEGYHGYWPLDSRAVDPRIGGEAALHQLVEAAHARGIRVLLDLVPNHLYEANPRVAQHWADGWFHERDPVCVCGAPDCSWSDFIATCWFTDYLPDLRFEHPDAMESVVDDTVWWLDTFDVDGFRIDAVPMMPRATTRRIVDAMRQQGGSADVAFAMGEIFTGAGASGTADIRYYLGPDGLDSAFDFPLMWALRAAIATETGSFATVEASLAETDRALDGSGAVLGRMIGNHDVTRFASEIVGDAGGDPWDDAPAQPTEAAVYEGVGLALGLVLSLPGLPVIYYGDELGLAGAADPDNRRVMPALADLAPSQVVLAADIQRLAQMRRCLPALRRGQRRVALVTDDTWAWWRDADDGAPALVVASRAEAATEVAVGANATSGPQWYQDVLSGDIVQLDPPGGARVAMPPRSLRVFVPSGHPCIAP
jgi:glycosidase